MIIPIEKIHKYFGNKYRAVNIAAMEARRQKELQSKGLLEEHINPIIDALRKLAGNRIKFKE